MCNIAKIGTETKKINFTKSVLYQSNNDSPHPPSQGTGCLSEPWTVQAAKEENNNNNNNGNNNNRAQSESFIRPRQLIKVMDSDLIFEELNSSKPSRICV